MKTINGNIIDLMLGGNFDVMVHGCNCFCTMNSGVARAVRHNFEKAYEVDFRTTIKGDRSKLGDISFVNIRKGEISFFVVNAYTQYDYGYDGKCRLNYDAVSSCFNKIYSKFYDKRICYPKLGAGLAGGDWKIISKIIDESLKDADHTLVELV
jgi:O-acetyl-ADP-ribose deacetylase (regulator of RNase III)